mgnify:CR=1 FL=1
MAPDLPAGREGEPVGVRSDCAPDVVQSHGSMERTPRLSACRCFFFLPFRPRGPLCERRDDRREETPRAALVPPHQSRLAHRKLRTMTAATLRSLTAKDLAQMARERGVAGWHSMRKEELIGALVRVAKRRSSVDAKVGVNGRQNGHVETPMRRDVQAQRKLSQLQDKLAQVRNLASGSADALARQDRLVVMVRDPYWLHAYWELSPRSIDRAQAAMGQRWHGAKPVIRVFRIQPDSAALLERDIAIHGGVRNWYVDVQDPPADYRLEIGYLGVDGFFYCLARSNEVSTPPAGTSDAMDDNWKACLLYTSDAADE